MENKKKRYKVLKVERYQDKKKDRNKTIKIWTVIQFALYLLLSLICFSYSNFMVAGFSRFFLRSYGTVCASAAGYMIYDTFSKNNKSKIKKKDRTV